MARPNRRRRRPPRQIAAAAFVSATVVSLGQAASAFGDGINVRPVSSMRPTEPTAASSTLDVTLDRLIQGPPVEVRWLTSTWVEGRRIDGVGHWMTAGGGTGAFRLVNRISDARNDHELWQVGDGRVVWTRRQIGEEVRLHRIDLTRIARSEAAAPGRSVGGSRRDGQRSTLRIGGLVEMVDRLRTDHVLTRNAATLSDQPVWVVTARPAGEGLQTRLTVLRSSAASSDRPIVPSDPSTAGPRGTSDQNPPTIDPNFVGYPVRIEWDRTDGDFTEPLMMIRLQRWRRTETPPPETFRFDAERSSADFVEETNRYLARSGSGSLRR